MKQQVNAFIKKNTYDNMYRIDKLRAFQNLHPDYQLVKEYANDDFID